MAKKGRDLDFQQRGMSKADYAKSTPGQNFGGRGQTPSTPQVQARTGPTQLPVIGPLTAGFNLISKSLYNRKNLQEAKKSDILGGEMLTTAPKQTQQATIGGDRNQLCPDGTYPPCKTPGTQTFDMGGEVVISSNVDKDLL